MRITFRVDDQAPPAGTKVVLFPNNAVCLSCDAPIDMAGQRAIADGIETDSGCYLYKLAGSSTCPVCGEIITHYGDASITHVHLGPIVKEPPALTHP
jgi:hypothetical protein